MTRLLPTKDLRAGLFAAAALACAALAGSADARKLEVDIEPLIILNCAQHIHYRVDIDALFAAASTNIGTAQGDATAGVAPRQIEARFAASERVGTDMPELIEIEIPESCTVRGLVRGEGLTVEVRPTPDTLLQNEFGGGSLRLHDVTARRARGNGNGNGGSYERRFSIPRGLVRLDRETVIDVKLQIDLSNAALAGRYSSPIDGVFAVEVTSP